MEHNQNPLTLEQLRQMDGQPVWCVSFVSGRPAEWAIIRIVKACGDWFIASSGSAQAFGGKNTYGKDWLAYEFKPDAELLARAEAAEKRAAIAEYRCGEEIGRRKAVEIRAERAEARAKKAEHERDGWIAFAHQRDKDLFLLKRSLSED